MLTRWMLAAAANAGGAPPASLLLDTYTGAAAAYSVRKLSTAYSGACLRVRRSSDSAEQDIGFSGNDLDTASLLSFVGSGDGLVVTWYDQSGNGRNYSQTSATVQPVVATAGVLSQQGGKAAVDFLASKRMTALAGPAFATAPAAFGVFCVASPGTATLQRHIFGTGAFQILSQLSSGGTSWGTVGNSSVEQPASIGFASRSILEMQSPDGDSGTFYLNASNAGTFASTIGLSSLGGGSGTRHDGTIQEIVFYETDQSSNRSGIESNINTYYTIY